MFPTTPVQWARVLGALGVRPATAMRWCEAFADECRPELFRRPEDELDDLLAQALYESGRLENVEEDLRYTAARIRELGARFGPHSRWAHAAAQADTLAGNPQALAEVLYGGRFGNTQPGDGWKFRGQGLPQITFRDNFARVGSLIGQDLTVTPGLLLQPHYAVQALVLWWRDTIPDSAINFDERIRVLVNGSTMGLDATRKLAADARAALENVA